jgi:LytS/YehU family sensor histidine kinase
MSLPQFGVRTRAFGLAAASWVLLALIRTSLRVVAIPRPFETAVAILGQVLAGSLLWLAWAPGVVVLAGRLPWRRGDRLRTVAIHLVLASAITVVEATWGWFVLPLAGYPITLSPGVWYLVRLDQICFLYICLVGLGVGLRHRARLDSALVRATALHAELLQARLHVLALQLHPHFLFNTLNAVSELVHRDAAAARRVLDSLRELLARSLDAGAAQEVPLREELALLEAYARIQRTRFADSLDIQVEAAPDTLDALVPRLVLQPLVENAIRHGTARRVGPGRVAVRTMAAEGRLIVEVADDGVGLPAGPNREGLGLANTRARLGHFFAGDARLTLEPAAGRGAVARIDCPMRKAVISESRAEHAREVTPVEDGGDTATLSPARVLGLIAAAWAVIAVVGANEDFLAAILAGDPQSFGEAFRPRFGEAALWLALTPAVLWISSRIGRAGLAWPAALAAHLVIGLAMIAAHLRLVDALVTPDMSGPVVAALLLSSAPVYAALATGGHAWTIRVAAAERRAAAVRLEGELAAARLELLRWQLRPELLFGALQRIGELAGTDSDQADELTGYLGELLRLMLQSGRSELVPLDREVRLVSAYCALEAAVRGAGGEPEMKVDAAARRALVPAMVLLPMIEIVSGEGPVLISGTVRNDALDLSVRAPCSIEPASARLLDLRRRLQAIYGDTYRLATTRSSGQAAIALRIPASYATTARAVA